MAERISSICAADISACGGISKARNSTRPRRPEPPVGEYILSMQNSVRWPLPVMSHRILRNSRSTSQGGVWFCAADLLEGDFQLVDGDHHALRRCADAADDGPMNRPANRKLKRGMVMPEAEHGFQQIRPAQERANPPGSPPPITTWLPPPVPT